MTIYSLGILLLIQALRQTGSQGPQSLGGLRSSITHSASLGCLLSPHSKAPSAIPAFPTAMHATSCTLFCAQWEQSGLAVQPGRTWRLNSLAPINAKRPLVTLARRLALVTPFSSGKLCCLSDERQHMRRNLKSCQTLRSS